MNCRNPKRGETTGLWFIHCGSEIRTYRISSDKYLDGINASNFFFLTSFDGGEENTLLNFLIYLEIANI